MTDTTSANTASGPKPGDGTDGSGVCTPEGGSKPPTPAPATPSTGS